MTNKVKPFYIRITDDMTPQMVQDAFDKCVDAGAGAHEGVAMVKRKHSYTHCYANAFGYFGISTSGSTFFADDESSFHCDAQETTLDQLDEWLGLGDVVEWKNGDECMIRGEKLIYIGESIEADIHCVQELDSCIYRNAHISVIEKPETPEQKAEREKREEAEEMIQCILDNYTNCEESAIEYVIDYLEECESLGR